MTSDSATSETSFSAPGPELKSLPAEVPLRSGRRQAATIGKALDFRLRLHLGWIPADSEDLESGIVAMSRKSAASSSQSRTHQHELRGLLASELPAGEDGLGRASVVLAWLDDLYRGNPWAEGLRRVAHRMRHGAKPTWEMCTAVVPADVANEVDALMQVAKREFASDPTNDAICGTRFDGSQAVGGADADVILGGTLYEVKTVKAPRDRLSRSVEQLLGYVLLDWNDRFRIERAGFYFSRQGKRMSWRLAPLIEEVTGHSRVTLEGLREDFRRSATRQAPRRHRGTTPQVR